MSKYAVIINSSDSTAHYGKGWNWFFQKNWNHELPYPVYFLTETKFVDYPGVTNLVRGRQPWRDFIQSSMDEINVDYAIFAMDDHMFLKSIDANILDQIFEYVDTNSMKRFGLYRKFHKAQEPTSPRYVSSNFVYRELSKNSNYLSCLQPSIWDMDFFLEILENDWSPWQMEWEGTIKIRKSFKPGLIGYISIPGWYAEAYQRGKPRPVDFELLTSIYDWR